MRLAAEGVVDLLDGLYATRDPDERMDRATRAVAAMAGARSGASLRYKATYNDGRFGVRSIADFQGFGPDYVWNANTPNAILHAPAPEVTFGKTAGATFSQASGFGTALASMPGWRDCWKEPIADSLGIISLDPDGDGILISVGLPAASTLDARQSRLLARLATHLGAAERLRGTVSADAADAVLSPSGKLLHAVEPARVSEVRDGVARRAFARKSRHDAEQALEAWQGLVDGAWSLVDHFDTDGKRFVLAMKNAPDVAPRAELAPQDRRVAALAAMGHRDKEIAYAFGITMGSVAAALRRARKAFGVTTRTELAAKWRGVKDGDAAR